MGVPISEVAVSCVTTHPITHLLLLLYLLLLLLLQREFDIWAIGGRELTRISPMR